MFFLSEIVEIEYDEVGKLEALFNSDGLRSIWTYYNESYPEHVGKNTSLPWSWDEWL